MDVTNERIWKVQEVLANLYFDERIYKSRMPPIDTASIQRGAIADEIIKFLQQYPGSKAIVDTEIICERRVYTIERQANGWSVNEFIYDGSPGPTPSYHEARTALKLGIPKLVLNKEAKTNLNVAD